MTMEARPLQLELNAGASTADQVLSLSKVKVTTTSELIAVLTEFARAAGFPYFALTARFRKMGARYALAVFSNFDDGFAKLYRDNNWAVSDPMIERAHSAVRPFRWGEVSYKSRPQRRQRDAAIRFGLTDGMTVPLHGPDGQGIALQLAGRRPPVEAAAWTTTAGHCLLFLAGLYEPVEQLLRPVGDVPTLTPTQRNVLSAMAAGKKPSDIHKALGLSARSVNLAIAAAIERLGASSREQALIIALAQGQISWMAPTPLHDEGPDLLALS